ncbi:MAG: tetratricopeptide repeat protein [Candidatus Melainabacteria bacterium]|nr:tetratricopeptide repeat protein [Candidatus Melainabacteria bacterium]
MRKPSRKALTTTAAVLACFSLSVADALAKKSSLRDEFELAPFVGGMSDPTQPKSFSEEFPSKQKSIAPKPHVRKPEHNNPWKPKIDPEDLKAIEKETEETEDGEEREKTPEDIEKEKKEAERAELYWSTDPHFYYKRANYCLSKKHYKQALNDLNEACQLKPDYWEARYLGAYIFQLQGRTNEAIDKYKEYIAVRPDDIHARINIGSLLRSKGDFLDAEENYRKAVETNFYSIQAHYNLANVLIDQHKHEEALKELKCCLKLDPKNAWVHNNIGVIYQKRNYLEEAEEEFVRALTLEPANRTFEKNLTLLRARKDKSRGDNMRADAADVL